MWLMFWINQHLTYYVFVLDIFCEWMNRDKSNCLYITCFFIWCACDIKNKYIYYVKCLPLCYSQCCQKISVKCFYFMLSLQHAIPTIYNLSRTPITAITSCRQINYHTQEQVQKSILGAQKFPLADESNS